MIMADERPILLIGFMCTGKSTVGRMLARSLSRPFIDLDRQVEARVGPLVPFFQREGEEAFRRLEAEALAEALEGPVAVIATGGGTPCEGDNLARMQEAGTVIWLDVGLDALMSRIIRAGGDRPLLRGLQGDALRRRVEELLALRRPIYREAHLRVQADDPPEEVAASIAALLGQSR